MLSSIALLSVCSIFTGLAFSLNIPIRRETPHSTTLQFVSESVAHTGDKFRFLHKNEGDNAAIYVGTIMVANKPFEVQLDTGSSDLWLDTVGVDTSEFTTTDIHTSLTYADKTVAAGPIILGNISFGDFIVGDQAFISAPGSNATTNGDKGLMGIGPPSLSTINRTLSRSKYNGRSFLDNVFALYPEEPNFITFALNRSMRGVTDGGIFTIGELPSQFSEIETTTPLPVDAASHHWITPLDAVIVNGQRLSGHGRKLNSTPTALLDTGSSLAFAPPFFVDAIYSSVPGAELDQENGLYTVPCESMVEITFVFGGATFPIHPIDATFVLSDGRKVVCAGTFMYNKNSEDFDFLLGDSFLRNVYSLYDFGSWTSVADSAPFMKLLSVTDAAKANVEFEAMNKARIDQVKA